MRRVGGFPALPQFGVRSAPIRQTTHADSPGLLIRTDSHVSGRSGMSSCCTAARFVFQLRARRSSGITPSQGRAVHPTDRVDHPEARHSLLVCPHRMQRHAQRKVLAGQSFLK